MHNVNDLISLFNRTFVDYQTELVRGQDEPIYLPAKQTGQFNQIIFAHGFFASALHEIAHWCIAGAERRKLEDFGYWYEPDGRSKQQQYEFEKVEIKPQALEWAFSIAAGVPFRVSVDNLNGDAINWRTFQNRVCQQLITYQQTQFPARAQRWIDILSQYYAREGALEQTIAEFQCSPPN